MRRRLLALPIILLVAGIGLGAGYFALNATDAPERTVAAAELELDDRPTASASNVPLEGPSKPQPEKPIPEPQPEPPTPEATEEPSPEETLREVAKKLDDRLRSDLTDAEKRLRTEDIIKDARGKMAQNAVTLKGRVLDHEGNPFVDAHVMATFTGAVAEGGRNPTVLRAIGRSDAEGNFEGTFAHGNTGEAEFELELFARSSITPESEHQKVSVTPGQTTDNLVITMPHAAGITGRVVDGSFNPIVGARVIAVIKGGAIRGGGHSAFTGDDGRFTLSGLGALTYLVNASASGYGAEDPTVDTPLEITVPVGEIVTLPADIVLSIQTGLKVKLTSTGRQPRGYFTANFYKADGTQVRGAGMAESDGTAVIVGVPLDAIELEVVMRGYLTSARIRIAPVEGAHTDAGETTLDVDPNGKLAPNRGASDENNPED